MSGVTATILGCGPSPGVPRIDGDWGRCDPSDSRNRRSRCSLLLQRVSGAGTTNVLIDTSPDMRAQLLAARISHIDAVLYTHAHADHIHGIDDLRAFWMRSHQRVNVHADAATGARLLEAFRYCFETPPGSNYPPILNLNALNAYEPLTIDGAGGAIEVLPYRQVHGTVESLGFRTGRLAYSCDVSALDDDAQAIIQGVDTWVVDALRYDPHPSHFNLEQSLHWIDRLGVKHAVLTHMDFNLDYEELRRGLPAHVVPAHDGMVLAL